MFLLASCLFLFDYGKTDPERLDRGGKIRISGISKVAAVRKGYYPVQDAVPYYCETILRLNNKVVVIMLSFCE